MALRLSGQLLLGVVRIFSRKTRYLLEDCNEALVKIKMAFKPGVVDMNHDQSVANSGAITMAETINEFDILLSDPVLDLNLILKGNASTPSSRQRDITLDEDATLLSFSQDPDESAFQRRYDDVEVGRDAISRQYSPALDPSLLPEDIINSMEKPRRLDIELEDALGNQGEIDFGFDGDLEMGLPNNEPFGMPDDNMADFGNETFQSINPEQEMSVHGELEQDVRSREVQMEEIGEFQEPSVNLNMTIHEDGVEKVVRKKVQRKPKATDMMDKIIELKQFKTDDTSDITAPGRFIPGTRFEAQVQKAMEAGVEYFVQSRGLKRYIGVDESLFEPLQKKIAFVPNIALAADGYVEEDRLYDVPEMDPNGDMTFGNISEIQPDMSYGFDEPYGFEDKPESPSKKSKVSHQDIGDIQQDFDQSIIMADESNVAGSRLEFDTIDEQLPGENEKDLSKNSARALQLIQETLEETEKSSASFFEISKTATKAAAAKLFFEILVLNSKNVTKIAQQDAFGDILIELK